MTRKEAPFTSLLDDLEESGRRRGVTVGEILEAFEHRSLGVLLTLLGLIAILPVIGDIPGASISIGTLTLVAITQSLLGHGKLWAPEFIRRREFDRSTLDNAVTKMRPWIRRIESLLKPRLEVMVEGRIQRGLVLVAVAVLAVTLYPLAFVPFGANAPALGMLAFGLGLITSDGLIILVGYMITAATTTLLITLIL